VYEFDNVEIPDTKSVIFDLAIPTESSANFWIDKRGKDQFSVGIMILTRTDEQHPRATPPKARLNQLMGIWLNILRMTGTIARERTGLLPMTDFKEPAVYDNVLFAGSSATRIVPNTGFGFFPALEQGALAAQVANDALQQWQFSQKFLQRYDRQWLAKNEAKSWLNLAFQNLHYGYRNDEYFHDLSEKSLALPPRQVKRRILDIFEKEDVAIMQSFFMKNRWLISRARIHPHYFAEIISNLTQCAVCLFSGKIGIYYPDGNRMFKGRRKGILSACNYLLRRSIPALLCGIVVKVVLRFPVRQPSHSYTGGARRQQQAPAGSLPD
jgi:flavin-dependent dehydrogenase